MIKKKKQRQERLMIKLEELNRDSSAKKQRNKKSSRD